MTDFSDYEHIEKYIKSTSVGKFTSGCEQNDYDLLIDSEGDDIPDEISTCEFYEDVSLGYLQDLVISEHYSASNDLSFFLARLKEQLVNDAINDKIPLDFNDLNLVDALNRGITAYQKQA